MTDKLQYAWQLAARFHEGQRYKTPDPAVTLPYLTHLGAVFIEAQAAARQDPALDAELLLLCAILHDLLEDTELSEATIRAAFGQPVLDGVRALTKDETLPTKRKQMADSLRRIQEQPREIAVVKMCDRICNLGPPPGHWTVEWVEAYREEAVMIMEQLGAASVYLSERLRAKIVHYGLH